MSSPGDSPLSPTLGPVPTSPAERALDDALALVERLSAVIEAHLAELLELAPRLVLGRGLHDGAWLLGVTGDRERDGAAFGRLVFQLRVGAAAGELRCTARGTAGARDRHVEELELALDDGAPAALADFTERVVLGFADAYFSCDPATTRRPQS